jgi:hypothetical protein
VLVTDVVPATTGLFVISDRVVEVVPVANVVVVEVDEVVDVEADEVVVTVVQQSRLYRARLASAQ